MNYILTIPRRFWFTLLLFTLIPAALTFYIWTESSKNVSKMKLLEWDVL